MALTQQKYQDSINETREELFRLLDTGIDDMEQGRESTYEEYLTRMQERYKDVISISNHERS